jgi:hypothetical protein
MRMVVHARVTGIAPDVPGSSHNLALPGVAHFQGCADRPSPPQGRFNIQRCVTAVTAACRGPCSLGNLQPTSTGALNRLASPVHWALAMTQTSGTMCRLLCQRDKRLKLQLSPADQLINQQQAAWRLCIRAGLHTLRQQSNWLQLLPSHGTSLPHTTHACCFDTA